MITVDNGGRNSHVPYLYVSDIETEEEVVDIVFGCTEGQTPTHHNSFFIF